MIDYKKLARKTLTEEKIDKYIKSELHSIILYVENKSYDSLCITYHNLALLYDLKDDIKESEKYYRKIIEMWEQDPMNKGHHFWVSESYEHLGEYEKALKCKLDKKSHAFIDPENISPALYEKAGQYEKARELRKKKAEENEYYGNIQSNPCTKLLFFQTASDLYAELGGKEKAQQSNQNALEFIPDTEERLNEEPQRTWRAHMLEAIGHALEKAGKFEKAIEYYDKAIEMWKIAEERDEFYDPTFGFGFDDIFSDHSFMNVPYSEHFFIISYHYRNEIIEFRKGILEEKVKDFLKKSGGERM